RCAAGRRDLTEQRTLVAGMGCLARPTHERDRIIVAPRSAARNCRVAQGYRRAAVHRHFLQLAVREIADPPTIRREKRARRPACAFDARGRQLIHVPDEQLRWAARGLADERKGATVSRNLNGG